MEDVITLHLHQEGVVQHPDIELVKMRGILEQNTDAVTKEILDNAKEQGYLEKATKYMIDNKLKLDMDDEYSDVPFEHQAPVKYAIENNIKIEGKDAKQYALEKVIDEYLKALNSENKKELDTRYKEIHQMGNEKTSALLFGLQKFLYIRMRNPYKLQEFCYFVTKGKHRMQHPIYKTLFQNFWYKFCRVQCYEMTPLYAISQSRKRPPPLKTKSSL